MAAPNGHHLQDVPPRYLDNLITEYAEPQTEQHFSYLKTIGWQGLVDGRGSGVFCASPLSRMNVAEGMATPRAQEEYEQFYDALVAEEGARYLSTGPGRALHHVLSTHWARLIEMLYAAERIVELASDPTLTADDLRTAPAEPPTDGIGIVEAPSGTITHHYWADENGIVTQARLMSGTRNNLAAIGLTIKKAAQDGIRRGSLTTNGLRKSNRVGDTSPRSVFARDRRRGRRSAVATDPHPQHAGRSAQPDSLTVPERSRMTDKKIPMEHDKRIALVAHDNKKRDLVEWARFNRDLLAHHQVYATGTTGAILEQALNFKITKLKSGPLGGDQQIGAKIADAEIDFLIFFWDPLEPQPHDPDVKALLRMAVVWNIPIACNRASADFMISSPLMDGEYDRLVADYDGYMTRKVVGTD